MNLFMFTDEVGKPQSTVLWSLLGPERSISQYFFSHFSYMRAFKSDIILAEKVEAIALCSSKIIYTNNTNDMLRY